MEDIGQVKNIEKKQIEVEIDPGDLCGSCANKAACQIEGESGKRTMFVQSEMDVKEGDMVQINVPEGSAVFSAFLVFIVPLIFLGAGYFVGAEWGQGWGILSAFLGLGFGLLVVRLVDRWIGAKASFQPHITKILDEGPTC
jgi:sigma-E factor negative regulatory protein RseC